MGCVLPLKLKVLTDNNQAISFSHSTCNSSRLRGVFSRHWAYVKELKDGDELDLSYVAAENNAANILTKSLHAYTFKREKRLILSQWGVGRSEASFVVV